MKQIYCLGCRREGKRQSWFDAKLAECPVCGWVRPGFNKWARTAQLNDHLYASADRADREKKVERQLARNPNAMRG